MPNGLDPAALLSRRSLLIAATVLVAAAISLALTLARADEPRATALISAQGTGGPSGPALAALVERRLEDPDLTVSLDRSWGRAWWREGLPLLRSGVTVEEPAPTARRVEISFRSAIRERSVRLARLVAAGITRTTADVELRRRRAERKLAGLQRRLADPELGAAQRRALLSEERFTEAGLPNLREQTVLKGRVASSRPGARESLTSRLLPGDDPPRPSPQWAALAGGIAVGLCRSP